MKVMVRTSLLAWDLEFAPEFDPMKTRFEAQIPKYALNPKPETLNPKP